MRNLLTIAQIAGFLDTEPTRISYVVRKHGIPPHTKQGRIRLFTWQQVKTIRQVLGCVRSRKPKVKKQRLTVPTVEKNGQRGVFDE